ncbi:MAG: hypothetical protein LBI05_03225 [Planctomycetaceae bacterium]|jgi:hypothetical protein|nr:hypothetical protein [Planctomycetaceae bacterium]
MRIGKEKPTAVLPGNHSGLLSVITNQYERFIQCNLLSAQSVEIYVAVIGESDTKKTLHPR